MKRAKTTEVGKPKAEAISRKVIIIVGCVVVFAALVFVGGRFALTKAGVLPDSDLRYTQEYIAGTGNIKGDVNLEYFLSKSSDFEIGANQYGYAVFKNPRKAFERLKEEYRAGIELIQREFDLPPLSGFTYKAYKTYGWQVNSGDTEEREQAFFVSQFFDIYENSCD